MAKFTENYTAILEAYKHHTRKEVAKMFNCSTGTVKHVCRKFGYVKRPECANTGKHHRLDAFRIIASKYGMRRSEVSALTIKILKGDLALLGGILHDELEARDDRTT